MKCHVGGLRPLLLLPFASLLAVVLTTELHAQTCDLSDAPQAVKVDAASSTRFVPSGNTAEVYVQRKHSDTLVVRVFETNEPQVAAPKQVPERLVLSKRTVESHMYRAMQKLGISDRRELLV